MVPSTVIYNEYLQKFRRYIRHHEMVLGGEHVLLAVSGGVDSIALLDMMARIAPELKLQIGVAHFDHGLRGDAAHRDASFVVEQARMRGIKAYVGRGDVKKLASEYKLSIEEAGRKARYAFLKRVAQKHRYSVVMTGHNANDNAETLLMNLLRGSGVKGLAAIPPVRSLMRGVVLARPLLEFERDVIEEYAQEMEIEWSEDETNKSPQFLRNRVRAELIPLLKQFNPSIVGTLASTANIMQCLEQYISQTVDHAIERVVTDRTKESLALKLNQLKHYLPAMQTEIVQRSVSDVFEIPPISYGAIERTLGLMWKESGSKAEIGNGITAVRDRETLEVRRELPPPPPVTRTFRAGETVQVGRTMLRTEFVAKDAAQPGTVSSIEFIDAAKITGELTLRSWKEGDRFRPFGMDGEKKLSDFLIDKKVPLDRKARILVVVNGDQIVWVCGLRLDDRYKITPETEKVLRLELEVVSDNNQRPNASRPQQGRNQPNRGNGQRSQPAQQGGERGGDARRDDRRGERREDDRREGAAGRGDERPRDRREGEGDPRERSRDSRQGDRPQREQPRDRREPRNDDRSEKKETRPEESQDRRDSRSPRADERSERNEPRDNNRTEQKEGREPRESREQRGQDRRDQREPRNDEGVRRNEAREPRRDDRRDDRSDRRETRELRSEEGAERNDSREPRRDDRRDERPDRREPREPRSEEGAERGEAREPRRDDRRDDRPDRREPREPRGENRSDRREPRGDDRSDRREPRRDQRQPRPPVGDEVAADARLDDARPEPRGNEQERKESGREPERRDRPERRNDSRRPKERPSEDAPMLRNEPDWGDQIPHGFGDEEYQRGEIPDSATPLATGGIAPIADEAPSVEPAPARREPRGPHAPRSSSREPRRSVDVVEDAPSTLDAPVLEPESASGEVDATADEGRTGQNRDKRRGGRSRGGRGRGRSTPETESE